LLAFITGWAIEIPLTIGTGQLFAILMEVTQHTDSPGNTGDIQETQKVTDSIYKQKFKETEKTSRPGTPQL